ncbi:YIP1 family protein [Xinfangfangia sp. D13-10-4-6]|uniref:YIP1 family protein n=1 Tax=Pseudogemmobacter hezensis TaxID=2737662 RepID=UPI001553DD99|nr:YIP1 family protein [Pseudogemmobacter hezensis]NPD16929.1 YIP1 family protein [Pseudogemmobacter hezensis]
MSITTDIFRTWRRPGTVMREKLAEGPREEKALIVLFSACLLLFVAQWPRLSREAFLAQEAARAAGTPLDQVPGIQALLGINFFVYLFVLPLIFYAVAALSALVIRLAGGRIGPYAARISLFWALLCTGPLMLFQGLLAGFKGPGMPLTVVGLLIAALFIWLWVRLLREAMQ